MASFLKSIMASRPTGVMDRERLCNDILNTSVMAALVGGFALSNLQVDFNMDRGIDIAIYTASFIAVHGCTCSCITSAMLYRAANRLKDDDAAAWERSHRRLVSLPMVKFAFGCISYLLSVCLVSFRDLKGNQIWQCTALAIGVLSMSTAATTITVILSHTPSLGAVSPVEAIAPSDPKSSEVAEAAGHQQPGPPSGPGRQKAGDRWCDVIPER
mmetsp:Transcript_28856/g.78090  ORF Transcript_28856/g.78090 Transcript_28856/m.78090 type:complete len:214 (-) Transcript_28856:152-793(-)